MRVLSTQEGSDFRPITLAVSIESKDELQAIYQLCNYGTAVSELVDTQIEFDNGTVKPTLKQFLENLYEQLSAYHSRYC